MQRIYYGRSDYTDSRASWIQRSTDQSALVPRQPLSNYSKFTKIAASLPANGKGKSITYKYEYNFFLLSSFSLVITVWLVKHSFMSYTSMLKILFALD